MKLLTPLLWVAALAVAVWIVLRGRAASRPALVRAPTRRFVRMVAVLVVVLSGWFDRPVLAQENDEPAPRTEPLALADDAFPKDFELYQHLAHHQGRSSWQAFKGARTGRVVPDAVDPEARLPEAITALFDDDAPRPSADDLVAALDAAEGQTLFDGWLAARVWRRATGLRAADLPPVLARLERYLRLVATLRRTEATVGTISQRAWMSKAGPGPEERRIMARFVPTATRVYPTSDAGTFDDEGAATLRLTAGGPVRLHRRGQTVALGPGSVFTFRRLDVLEVAGEATLEHALLGALTAPAGRWIGPTDGPSLLSEGARQKIDEWVAAGAAGDPAALVRLERVLPFAHRAIARRIADGDAEGLEMLDALFQE